jgi:hypothetical protein
MADQKSRGDQKQGTGRQGNAQEHRYAHAGEQPQRSEGKKAEDAQRGRKGRG